MAEHKDKYLYVARAVIRDEANRILLLKRAKTDKWELPGGKPINEVDDILWAQNAVCREIKEEIGLDFCGDNICYGHSRQIPRFGWSIFYETTYFPGTAKGRIDLTPTHSEYRFVDKNTLWTIPVAFGHQDLLADYFLGRAGIMFPELKEKRRQQKERLHKLNRARHSTLLKF